MAKQFAVVGLGRFGYAVAKELEKQGKEVFAVDTSEERVEAVKDKVTHAVIADASNEQDFKALGLGEMDCVVVAIGENLPSTIMVCMLAKEAGVPLVVAKASLDIHGKILERVGADQIVYPEADMGKRLAHRLAHQNVIDQINLAGHFQVNAMRVPTAWVGKTIGNLDVRAKYNVSIVAIEPGGLAGEILIAPRPSYILQDGDLLSLIGKDQDVAKLEAKFAE